MRGGWRFLDGRWISEPLNMGAVVAGPPNFRFRFLLDTAEDVELYAAELGISRREIHR